MRDRQRGIGRQRGVSVLGLIFGLIVLIVLALLAMRLTPSYLEFFAIQKALNGIAVERRGGGSASVSEIRRAFEARAAIDDFTSVKGADLEITKDGNDVLISASYRKEVPLFSNIGVYIDFQASSRD